LNSTVKCKHPIDSKIEYLFIELSSGCIYRPNRNIECAFLINVQRKILVDYTDVIITGDLNSNILRKKHLLLFLYILRHILPLPMILFLTFSLLMSLVRFYCMTKSLYQ